MSSILQAAHVNFVITHFDHWNNNGRDWVGLVGRSKGEHAKFLTIRAGRPS